jgi:hypothetical protein
VGPENILGTHPPEPPPTPALKPNPTAGQTMRQRMKNTAQTRLRQAAKMMDPIGFALENFDGTGK